MNEKTVKPEVGENMKRPYGAPHSFGNDTVPGPKVLSTPCLIWRWGKNNHGYGFMQVLGGRGRRVYAHRFFYEQHVGPIPPGLTLDHLCRNPACVNPEHLEPVTHRENLLRGVGSAALNARKTHCPAGHLYSEHGYIRAGKHGDQRRCRPCDKAYVASHLKEHAEYQRNYTRRKAQRAAEAIKEANCVP